MTLRVVYPEGISELHPTAVAFEHLDTRTGTFLLREAPAEGSVKDRAVAVVVGVRSITALSQ